MYLSNEVKLPTVHPNCNVVHYFEIKTKSD